VIGAGVNVNIRPEDFPDDLKEIATSLAIIKGEPVPRLALFVEILTALEEVYFDVLLNGFEETLREWRKYAVTLGQEVSVVGINETFNGTAVDIDEDGALLIDTAEGYRRVLAGDVSIRPRKK
ncbi:MAG: biotin--[acetyl-CoA-carboxylase] ligase, partial [Negativicutes bacterium]